MMIFKKTNKAVLHVIKATSLFSLCLSNPVFAVVSVDDEFLGNQSLDEGTISVEVIQQVKELLKQPVQAQQLEQQQIANQRADQQKLSQIESSVLSDYQQQKKNPVAVMYPMNQQVYIYPDPRVTEYYLNPTMGDTSVRVVYDDRIVITFGPDASY